MLETPSTLEPFRADAMLVADGGNIRPGVPSLTVGLRGDAPVFVEVRTLGSAKHSGQFGGAAPDALIALTARARLAPRRERGRRRRRSSSRRVEGCVLDRRRVPPTGGNGGGDAIPRYGLTRRPGLVGSGDHRDRDRRALGGRRGQRRLAVCSGAAERARPPRAGRGGGAGGRDPASRAGEAVRDPAPGVRRRHRQRVRRRDDGARLPGGVRRLRDRLGQRAEADRAPAARSRS